MTGPLVIARLGAQGDGVADGPSGPVYVPFALPGETVTVAQAGSARADLISVLDASPQRVDPACRHFGTCGGCALQHLEDGAYRAWKRDKVVQALRGVAAEADVSPLLPCAPGTRRRVALTARRTERGMLLGFVKALSSEIVGIEDCPVALPAIVAALPVLRRLADLVCATTKPFRMTVTATASGLDVAVADGGRLPDARRREAADAVLRAPAVARLTMDGEIVVEPRKPTVIFGSVAVETPPAAFLQATAAAEEAMAGLAAAHLSKAKRVADLFSGCGTFALRLAARAEVHAVEGDAAALAALDKASRFATGLRRVATERRDLFRRPLTVKELAAFDGVVFDPPRAGAEDQSKQLARSDVPFVVAVSCNPATLSRDLAILVAGGYRLAGVTPIDQFLWSPHVEAVALLEKPRRRR